MTRPWPPADRARLCREYGTTPTAALAAALGRTPKAVREMAFRLGRVRPNHRWTRAADATLRRLNAAGHSDGRVAAALRCDRATVRHRRHELGLPSNQHGPHHHDNIRRKAREQVERMGLKSLGELRVKAWGDHAERHGLPRELNPTAVRVVLALAAGPKTRRQIVAALGYAWKTANGGRNNLTCGRQWGSYPAWLIALGLVESVRRHGRHRLESVYRLTPAAVARLTAAGVPVRPGCSTPGCLRAATTKGLCGSCYNLAHYHRKKHDPEWYARTLEKQEAARERRRAAKALADLSRIAAELEARC